MAGQVLVHESSMVSSVKKLLLVCNYDATSASSQPRLEMARMYLKVMMPSRKLQ
jgi:hypothetical protein